MKDFCSRCFPKQNHEKRRVQDHKTRYRQSAEDVKGCMTKVGFWKDDALDGIGNELKSSGRISQEFISG